MKTLDGIEKIYFSVAEVADIINEKSHTVRFWHDVFGVGARLGRHHRLYTKDMIAKMHIIQRLLRKEKYTIEGAKQKLYETYIP